MKLKLIMCVQVNTTQNNAENVAEAGLQLQFGGLDRAIQHNCKTV